MKPSDDVYTLIGWREWIVFPDFENARVKAKVDTGARTSAIHAEDITLIEGKDGTRVDFLVHPNQDDDDNVVECSAKLIDRRTITDSGGHKEERFIVQANIQLGGKTFPIELSLTDRDSMGFRMLLGRTAMKKRFRVQPDRSFLHGR